MKKNSYIYLILAIIVLALSLRVIYLVQTKDNPLFKPVDTGLDPSLYHKRAQLIAQGTNLAPDFIYGMPLYPYFLSLIYNLLGENIFAARLIQMLLGSLSCLIIYFIGKQAFNRRVGLIAMFLSALYGMFIFYEGMLLGTALAILFNCLIMVLLFSIQKQTNLKKWLLLGLLVGISGLNRASIFLFIPFILVWFSLTAKEIFRKKLFSIVIFCLTVLLVIAPITVRNYLIAKDFIPISAHSGINFYIGNNPDADGSFKPPGSMHLSVEDLFADSIRQAQRYTGKKMKPSEVSKFWFTQSIRFMQTQPLSYLKLLFRKFALLFNSYEIFDVIDFSFFRQNFPTILNLPLPNLRIILPLALLGLVLGAREWRQCLLLYLFILSSAISVVAYFVHARYRLPLVPFLIVFSAYTLDCWLRMLKHRNFRAVFLSLGGLVLLSLATNLKLTEQNYVSQYNNLGVVYKEMGKFELAIEAYKEALRISPELAQTHSNLGNLYNATGQYTEAVQELRRAIELDPNLAEAHSNLGIVYTKIGKPDLAIGEYRKAVQLRPNLFRVHYNLGVLYFKQGRFAQARAEWQKAREIDPLYLPAQDGLKKLE